MKNYLTHHPWEIIEEGFHPENNRISESIFSLGNGKIGQRGNFEEFFSGDTLRGNYISGVYYPDKTRVGWWKNGYPEYFAKVLNAPDWTGIKITISGEKLDLYTCQVSNFKRVLNMKEGTFCKSYEAGFSGGRKAKIESTRFISMVNDELGVIKFSFTPLNFSASIQIKLDIDADIVNSDSNYNEKFWTPAGRVTQPYLGVISETKKTHFRVCTSMFSRVFKNGKIAKPKFKEIIEAENYIALKKHFQTDENDVLTIIKFAAQVSSLNHPTDKLANTAADTLSYAENYGYEKLLEEHKLFWEKKWEESDIIIDGDVSAQQGIRFNIFQLNQTYTGKDERLNIGPKGFTGEKYGGSTYWDTEAYCLPFYLSTANQKIARQLLIYRYKHLPKAIENAEKLGFKNGAALFPMVTMNGEECHNEWEITFEEIHRNGAIAYAIYNYANYTNDKKYLAEYGFEVLIAISRFWEQRVNFSQQKQKYVMLGVTGPNEYENNVNNNWYTNTIACWTMKYTLEVLAYLQDNFLEEYESTTSKTKFDIIEEPKRWTEITENMYLPYSEEKKVFIQHDGFLDKELLPAQNIDPSQRPIHQHWSWDRILRSCYIKQADVLQGLFFFNNQYSTETIQRNYDFYEPMTVHESSLSSCVHSIIASRLGDKDRAYEFYLKAARLDLDNYNNDTEDGLHITSMGGSWMTIVHGFGRMEIKENRIAFNPFIPKQWKSYAFKVRFRESLLNFTVKQDYVSIENKSDTTADIFLFGKKHVVMSHQELTEDMPTTNKIASAKG